MKSESTKRTTFQDWITRYYNWQIHNIQFKSLQNGMMKIDLYVS